MPYTGAGCLASAIAMDKDMTKRLVSGLVTTPRWETVTVTADNLEELVEQTPLPSVVMPIASGSSSGGVTIAHDRAALRRGLEESMALGGRTVLEQYIKGREIQVAVLDGKALPSIEIIPQADFYDYENKYQPGAAKEVCPSEIPPEWRRRWPGGPGGIPGHRAVGVRPGGLHRHPGRHPLLFGDQHPAGMTPTSLVPQEAAAGGHRLRRAVRDHCGGLPPGAEGRSVTAHGSHYSAGAAGGGGGDPHRPAAGLEQTVSHVDTDSRNIHPAPCLSPWWGSALTATPTSTPPWRGEAAGCLTQRERESYREDRFILR